MRAPSAGVVWLGSQVFNGASAFNANIGAWDTASVTELGGVCAAFSARAARQRGRDALGRVFDAARAVVRGGTADARARVCAETCGHAHALAFPCADIAARSKDGLHVCMHT
jgi:surface protein